MAWPLSTEKLGIKLPEGFRLEEDEDYVYLFYRDTEVAVFSAIGVDPREIEKEAENCLGKEPR